MKLLNTLVTIALLGFSYVATRMYMCAFNVWISAVFGAVTVVTLATLIIATIASLTNMLEGEDRYEIEVVRKKKGQCDDPLRKWTH